MSLLAARVENSEPDAGREFLFTRTSQTRDLLLRTAPGAELVAHEGSHFQAPGLVRLERELFRETPTSPELDTRATGLQIFAANGVQSEIREIARRVKRLLATGGAKSDDIAIVFRTLSEVAPRLAEIARDYGLDLLIDHRQRLSATPVARLVFDLLRLAIEDWPFELLLKVLGNKNLSEAIGGSPEVSALEQRHAVERCIRRAQLPASSTLLMAQIRHWAQVVSTDEGESETSDHRHMGHDARRALPGLERLEKLFARLPLRAALDDWIEQLSALVALAGIARDDPHWRLLRQALARTLIIDQPLDATTVELDRQEILTLLQSLAEEVQIPAGGDAVGRVRVLSAEGARNLSVKHLFLAGLTEESFSSVESAGRLYSEQEVRHWAATPATNVQSSFEQQASDAMLLFYEMVTRASESLTLSYPAIDDKGQTLNPSPLLTEVERCFSADAIPKVTEPIGQLFAPGEVPSSQSEWRLTSVAAALEGEVRSLSVMVSLATSRTVAESILRGIACVGSRSTRDAFGPYEGILGSGEIRSALARRFDGEHLWSPSQLERYAECPYRFFASLLLKLERLEDIALRSDHLRRGTLLHQVLASVHDQYAATEEELTAADLLNRFTESLSRIIEQTPLSGLEDDLREIERREVISWAPGYAQQELEYRQRWSRLDEPLQPAFFEVRFGPKARDTGAQGPGQVSTTVPFTLDLKSEKIRLTGQIDRIDLGKVGGVTVFNIIDYKSGQAVKLGDAEILAGKQLQLPLYALAAEELLLADRQAVALATGYWSIQGKGFAAGKDGLLEIRAVEKGKLEPTSRWRDLQEGLSEQVELLIHGIRGGEFPVYNENVECTKSCDYSKLCRIAQIRSLEKTWFPHRVTRVSDS